MKRPIHTLLLVCLCFLLGSTASAAGQDSLHLSGARVIDVVLERLGYQATTFSLVELIVQEGMATERFTGEVWSLPHGLRRVDLTSPAVVEGTSAVVFNRRASVMTGTDRARRSYNLSSIVTLFTLADDFVGPALFDQPLWRESRVIRSEYKARPTYELHAQDVSGEITVLVVDAATGLPLVLLSMEGDERREILSVTDWTEDEAGDLASLRLDLVADELSANVTLERLNDIFIPRHVETRIDGLSLTTNILSVMETTIPDHLAVTPEMVAPEDERFLRATQFTLAERYSDARDELESLTRDDPYHVAGHIQLGYVYLKLGDWLGARSSFEQVLLLEPGNLIAANNLAYVYIESGTDIERGVVLARFVVERRPTLGAYLDTLGWGLYKAGELEEAVKVLEDAVTYGAKQLAKQDMAEVLYHYALALQAVGRIDEARDAIDQAIEADPQYEDMVPLRIELTP